MCLLIYLPALMVCLQGILRILIEYKEGQICAMEASRMLCTLEINCLIRKEKTFGFTSRFLKSEIHFNHKTVEIKHSLDLASCI